MVALTCLLLALLGVTAGAERWRSGSLDRELRSTVNSVKVDELAESIARHPLAVQAVGGNRLRDRLELDTFEGRVSLWCYWPPRSTTRSLLAMRWHDEVGWVVDVEYDAGEQGRLYAWLVQVGPRTLST